MPYADRTTVPIDRTKTEIETTLTRCGATRFAYFVEPKGAVIMFEVRDRRLRFNLLLPDDAGAKAERLRRQRWRSLLLHQGQAGVGGEQHRDVRVSVPRARRDAGQPDGL
jgi:hypothetical protein